MTFILDQGVEIKANSMACSPTSCPVLIQGVVGLDWSANDITGQNSPITIQPSGSTRSQDLNFAGSWRYGTGSFLTFSGGAPATDNVTARMNLGGSEVLATFTMPLTRWRADGDMWGPDLTPTIDVCSGTGATGTCGPSGPSGTLEGGTISINTLGGGEASNGIVHMVYPGPLGPLGSTCTLTPQSGDGFWVPGLTSVLQQGTTATSMQFQWINGGKSLTDAVQYNIQVSCRGF